MLDPGKFQEGTRAAQKLESLAKQHPDPADIPSSALPVIALSGLPHVFETSAHATSTLEQLITLLLRILHEESPVWPLVETKRISLEHLAQLGIIADWLMALKVFKRYIALVERRDVHFSNYRTLTWRHPGQGPSNLLKSNTNEIIVRQQLLIGMLLENHGMVWQSSNFLIVKGSRFWPNRPVQEQQPAWNMLPWGIECKLSSCASDAS